MNKDSNYCVICSIWPNDMKEHLLVEHGIAEDSEQIVKTTTDPKIYIRLVNWSYEPTTIQVITLDENEAFLLMPEDMYGLDTEVHVWQDNKKIEVWKWDTKSRSYIKEKW